MGFMDRIKGMIGLEDEYYDEDYKDEYYDDYEDVAPTEAATEAPVDQVAQESPRRGMMSMASSVARGMKICIQEPLTYDDGPGVIDNIIAGRTVVLNLEMLEVDKKRQIFDFVSGGVYAMSGDIQKVTKDIYVIVPKGVEVDGKIAETVNSKSVYQI